MKKKIFGLLLLILPVLSYAQVSLAAELAAKETKCIGDSLQLTTQQRADLNQIHLTLYQQKMAARQQYADSLVQLGKAISLIEGSRDSLYKAALPLEKYILYKKRKAVLLAAATH